VAVTKLETKKSYKASWKYEKPEAAQVSFLWGPIEEPVNVVPLTI